MKLVKNAIILGSFYPAGTEVECSEATAETGYKQFERALARDAIERETGQDTAALLGVTTDTVHVLVYALALLTRAMQKAQSVDDLKAAFDPFKDYGEQFLQKVQTGEIQLPYLVNKKGLAGVFTELAETATGTSTALSQVKQQTNSVTETTEA